MTSTITSSGQQPSQYRSLQHHMTSSTPGLHRRPRRIAALSAIVVTFISVAGAVAGRYEPADASASGGTIPGGITAGVSFGTPPIPGTPTAGDCRFELARPVDVEFGQSEPTSRWFDGRRYWLYDEICDGIVDTLWIPEMTPNTLGLDATAHVSRLLPAPRPALAPPSSRLVVQIPAWFWTDPHMWQPVEATAWVPTPAGILWATARARPTRLRLDVSDAHGLRRHDCAGPGPIWQPADGDRRGSSCQMVFTTTRGRSGHRGPDVTMSVSWSVDWWSSTGQSGHVGQLTTSTAVPVRVQEILALVSG